MSSGEAAMPDAEQPAPCMSACTGLLATDQCRDCGHLAALHIGVERCPVCELVEQNRQVRAALAKNHLEVNVTGVDEQVLERVIERMVLRSGLRSPGRFRR